MQKKTAIPLFLCALFSMYACTPPVAEEVKKGSSSHLDDETGTQTKEALYLEEQGDAVMFSPTDNIVTVCQDHADRSVWERVQAFQDQSLQVIFKRSDESIEARQTQPIKYMNTDPMCRGQGASYTLNLKPALSADFFKLDFTRDLVSSFGIGRFSCEGGIQLGQEVKVKIEGARYEDGELKKPELAIVFDREMKRGVKLKCSQSFDGKDSWIAIGGVPVLYKVTGSVGFEIAIDVDARVNGELGTRTNMLSLTSRAGEKVKVELSMQFEVGIILYKVIGGTVGVDVIPHADLECGKLDVGVKLKAGIQAGLLDASGQAKTRSGKDFEISTTKQIGAEISTEELGPFPLLHSLCRGGDRPACGPCQGFDRDNQPVERDCGGRVCAGDGMMWACTERGFESTNEPCMDAPVDAPPPPPRDECVCDGFDANGDAVRRTCGGSVCAGDGMMWTCTERGFEGTTTPCN